MPVITRRRVCPQRADDRVVPKDPFSLSGGGWGAWKIAARYSTTDLNIRFVLNYLHGWIDKPVSATNLTDAGS
jgi:phosphate-selective porin OprO and OprP